MLKRRAALLCNRHLLSESLEQILGQASDVELVGHWLPEEQALAHLGQEMPDVLIVAEVEGLSDQIASLTARLMEAFPDLPVIHVTLAQNVLRIHTQKTLPASSADLIDVIRQLPVHHEG